MKSSRLVPASAVVVLSLLAVSECQAARLFASTFGGGTAEAPSRIMELDPVTGGVINIFNSPSQPIVGPSAGLAFDGEFLYLTHQQEGTKLLKLNPDSGVVEGSFTMGAGLSSPGLAFLGGKLYATRSFGKIEVYDPLSGSLLDTLDFFEANPDIDKSPIGLAALSDPNGPDRLVTILGSGSDVEIAELNPNSAVVESSFALPEADGEKSPLGLAVVGESIYVGLHLATLEPGTGFVRQGIHRFYAGSSEETR